MEKPYLLFATPRSGSTPIYLLLLEYFSKTRGAQGLSEYFNLMIHSCWKEGDKIISSRYPTHLTNAAFSRLLMSDSFEIIKKTVDFRFSLIEEKPEKFFFKLFLTDHTLLHLLPRLKEKYDWIFLERRNVWEQALSFLISTSLEKWYQRGGLQWSTRSLKASHTHFHDFEKIFKRYQEQKTLFPPSKILYYEDFSAENALQFLKDNGFDEEVDLSKLLLPMKQNHRPKEEAFENIGEIKEWFRNSPVFNQ